MSRTGFSPAVRQLVIARSQGFCEACGTDRPEHLHHRRSRGMGSTHRPESNQAANALAVSSYCHLQLIEANPALALRNGWRVRQNDHPAGVPVLLHGSTWALLNDDGTVTPTTKPREA